MVRHIQGGMWYVVDQIGGPQYSINLQDRFLYYIEDNFYLGGDYLKLDVRPGPLDFRSDGVVVPYTIDPLLDGLNDEGEVYEEDTEDYEDEVEVP